MLQVSEPFTIPPMEDSQDWWCLWIQYLQEAEDVSEYAARTQVDAHELGFAVHEIRMRPLPFCSKPESWWFYQQGRWINGLYSCWMDHYNRRSVFPRARSQQLRYDFEDCKSAAAILVRDKTSPDRWLTEQFMSETVVTSIRFLVFRGYFMRGRVVKTDRTCAFCVVSFVNHGKRQQHISCWR